MKYLVFVWFGQAILAAVVVPAEALAVHQILVAASLMALVIRVGALVVVKEG